jgi:hypothetical protein
MRTALAVTAAAAAVLATAALSAPALAGARPHTATPACQVSSGNCAEPVEAQAPLAVLNYQRFADAGLTAHPVTTNVTMDPNNNRQDGRQDWTFQQEGVVPMPGGGRGGFGFTAFDRQNYGGRPVFELEWTPRGEDTGLCAHDTWTLRVQLRPCNGRVHQAWIVIFGALPLVPPPGSGFYAYALNAQQPHGRQLPTAQHHYCLTGTPGAVVGYVTAARCRSTGASTGTDQQWASLP